MSIQVELSAISASFDTRLKSVNNRIDTDVAPGLAGKLTGTTAQLLRSSDALTVSNDTITLWKGDGTSESVTISDANTWRGIDDVPVNGQTGESISSNWAYDHANASNPHGITLSGLGFTGATNANYITNNNQLTNGAGYQTSAQVTSAIQTIVDSAPAALDTLNEIAASLNDDSDFAGTMTTALAGKLSTTGKAADSDLLDGLDLHTGRNNQANKVVRTNGSGYVDFGWINTTSGNTTSTITDFYVNTNDGYIRKATKSHVKSQLGLGSAAYVATSTFDAAGSADAVNNRIDSEVLPAIPTNNNQLPNGAGYITSYVNTQRSDEEIRDVAAAQWVNGTNTTVVKDDANNTIKINSVNTNTTYSVGDGGLTQKNFTTARAGIVDSFTRNVVVFNPEPSITEELVKIGVGVADPQRTLTVDNEIEIQLTGYTDDKGLWMTYPWVAGVSTHYHSAWVKFNGDYASYSFIQNGNNRMHIAHTTGNVGIGTTNPSNKLDVNGDINFTGDLYQNGALFTPAGGGTTYSAGTGLTLTGNAFSLSPEYVNDGTYTNYTLYEEGVFSEVSNTNSTVCSVRVTQGVNTCVFNATVSEIYDSGWGIGKAFQSDNSDHAVRFASTATFTINNFSGVIGDLPNRLRFIGRPSGAYFNTCSWTISYTDGTTETGVTTVPAWNAYHDFQWNIDGSRTLASISCYLTGQVNMHPGIMDVDMFFPVVTNTPTSYGPDKYLFTTNQTYTTSGAVISIASQEINGTTNTSLANNRITFHSAGTYLISWNINWQSLYANRSTFGATAKLNGTTIQGSNNTQYFRYNTYGHKSTTSSTFAVTAGLNQYMEFKTFLHSGAVNHKVTSTDGDVGAITITRLA